MRNSAVAAVAALAIMVAGCSGGSDGSGDGPSSTGAASATSRGTPESVYEIQLVDAAVPADEAVARVAAARTLADLNPRLDDAATEAGDAAVQLGAITPPQDLSTEHADLVRAYEQLSTDVAGLSDSVQGRELCTPAGAIEKLRKTKGITALREVGESISAKNATVSVGTPTIKAPKSTLRRPDSGAMIHKGPPSGNGALVIDNGGKQDAVVSLVRKKKPIFSVYLRKGAKRTVSHIPDGTYRVYFTSGSRWDTTARAFSRNCSFVRFDDTIKFRTVRTATYISLPRWRITLQPVFGGTARTRDIDPKDFPAG
jgi:hypothetical protein